MTITVPGTDTPVGTVTLTPEGTLVFDPAPDYTGPVDFPYTVTDPSGHLHQHRHGQCGAGQRRADRHPDTNTTDENTTLVAGCRSTA